MPAAFGQLVERLVGAQAFFAPDGALIGAASAAISALVKPTSSDPLTAWPDYSLGRVTTCKYDPKTREVTREWAASTGGYKERNDVKVINDAFVFKTIDYAPQLVDQLMFGTASLATAGSQQAFQKADRYKDGWLFLVRVNEAGVQIGKIIIHARLTMAAWPEDTKDPGSPEFRATHLADAGALDTILFAVG